MGGFLSGYKTYAVAALMVVSSFVQWAVDGNATAGDFVNTVFSPEVLNGLGLAALRSGIATTLGR